jgi:hypothetical protein
MAIQRSVNVSCDGPCGTLIKDSDKIPLGWIKVSFDMWESLKPGEKPTLGVRLYLCPKCTVHFTSDIDYKLFAGLDKVRGLVAQRLEQTAHNRQVLGSSPSQPTNLDVEGNK